MQSQKTTITKIVPGIPTTCLMHVGSLIREKNFDIIHDESIVAGKMMWSHYNEVPVMDSETGMCAVYCDVMFAWDDVEVSEKTQSMMDSVMTVLTALTGAPLHYNRYPLTGAMACMHHINTKYSGLSDDDKLEMLTDAMKNRGIVINPQTKMPEMSQSNATALVMHAIRVIDWMKNRPIHSLAYQNLRNMRELCNHETIDANHLHMVPEIYKYWHSTTEKQIGAPTFVGSVGNRIELKNLMLIRVTQIWRDKRGVAYSNEFVDECGRLIVWKSSVHAGIGTMSQSEAIYYSGKATIVAHEGRQTAYRTNIDMFNYNATLEPQS